MIKQLTDAIQKSKTFVSYAMASIDGYCLNISDYGYDAETNSVFLFCDPSDESAIAFTKIFAEAHKHPTATLTVVCEEVRAIFDVSSYRVERGIPSFGESNYVVLS